MGKLIFFFNAPSRISGPATTARGRAGRDYFGFGVDTKCGHEMGGEEFDHDREGGPGLLFPAGRARCLGCLAPSVGCLGSLPPPPGHLGLGQPLREGTSDGISAPTIQHDADVRLVGHHPPISFGVPFPKAQIGKMLKVVA